MITKLCGTQDVVTKCKPARLYGTLEMILYKHFHHNSQRCKYDMAIRLKWVFIRSLCNVTEWLKGHVWQMSFQEILQNKILKQKNFTNYIKTTLQAMFLTKTWMSSECKIFFFFPKHYLLQSYTSYSATHAKEIFIESQPSKSCNLNSLPL